MKLFLVIGTMILLTLLAAAGYHSTSVKVWLSDATMPMREGMRRSKNVMIPMRDGVRLAADVYRPLGESERYPVIYIRTPYGGIEFSRVKHFVENGYAVVFQHVRGRFYSEGTFNSPYRTAKHDGYDTIDWIVSQSWSTGKIGTFGCSYLGESQIILAAENHPNHIAMIASGAGGALGKAKGTYGYFGVFENGVLNLSSSLGWFTAEGARNQKVPQTPEGYEERMRTYMDHLPISSLAAKMVPYQTGFEGIVNHALTDNWWDEEGYTKPDDQFSAATLHINDWFDQTAHNTFKLAEHMAENAKHPRAKSQPVIMAPGLHCAADHLNSGRITVGELKFNYTAKDFQQVYVDWFDYWLKGKEKNLPPAFEYFRIHTGQWETSEQWPPASAKDQRFYLNQDHRLRVDDNQNEDSTFHQFTYDPRNPVPTIGGPFCCTYRPEDKAGPLDQTSLKSRDDVLVYSTNALESDIELIGNPRAVLFVSTDSLDTDFTVKLIDQYPDGTAYSLQDGVVRLRYRESIKNPTLAEPGDIYRIELEIRPLAYRFKKGHKIEIHISSSNFPRLARNLNTGEDEYADDRVVVATNRVYMEGDTASYIELPIKAPD